MCCVEHAPFLCPYHRRHICCGCRQGCAADSHPSLHRSVKYGQLVLIMAVLGWFTDWVLYRLKHPPNWSYMPWIALLPGQPGCWCSVPWPFCTGIAWDGIFSGFNLGKLWCRPAEPKADESSDVPRMLLSASLNISRGTSWHKEAFM